MAKLFDENGNEVAGAMTKEEADKAVEDAKKAAVPQETDEQKQAREKKEKEDANVAAGLNPDGTPKEGETADQRLERLEKRELANRTRDAARTYAGNDAEKIKQFEAKFGRLTGYADTDEGWAERAKDAATMAFGKAEAIDMRGAGDSGSGRSVDNEGKAAPKEADTVLGKHFGITDKDRQEYGGEEKK